MAGMIEEGMFLVTSFDVIGYDVTTFQIQVRWVSEQVVGDGQTVAYSKSRSNNKVNGCIVQSLRFCARVNLWFIRFSYYSYR